MQAFLAFVFTSLGIQSLPKDDGGKLAFSAEQEEKLQEYFPGENFATAKEKLNEFLAEENGEAISKQTEIEKANQLLASVLDTSDDEDENKPVPQATTIVEAAQNVATKVAEQQQTIQTLMNEPEAPSAMKTIAKAGITGVAMLASMSTSTHLFAQVDPQANNKFFAFEGRNWNQRAAGKSAAVTDFTDVSTITRLNKDLKDYTIQNPTFLRDLIIDSYLLPSFWPKRYGVIDQVSDAVFALGNVTQARKPDWTPGLELYIEAEKRRIYRIQIDLEFNGYQLQELEASWLQSLFNFDGSSPYKHSFIAYLIAKVYEKARQEDAEGAINGIYAPNVHGITVKGHYLNAQSGIRHQLYMFRDIFKTITPYVSKVGKFSGPNAQDYVKGFVESVPAAVRNRPGSVLYMSPSNLTKVQQNFKDKNAMHNDYTGNVPNYIEGYPNITFETLVALEGSNLMFITGKDNIEILEYIEKEKEIFRIEELKRDTFVHADYRFGCAFVFSGVNLPANSEFKGVAQYIWVNDEPIFPATVTVPLFGNPLSTPVEINYNRLNVHPQLVGDVTTLTGMPAGTVVELVGTALMVSGKKIKKKTGTVGNLDLTKDFDPKTEYKLILAVQTDGTYKELARISAFPTGAPAEVTFDENVMDVADGNRQKYVGESATLTEIVGGNEGTEITILGGDHALTVDAVDGKIVLSGGTASLTSDKSLTLKNFGGVWYETARV